MKKSRILALLLVLAVPVTGYSQQNSPQQTDAGSQTDKQTPPAQTLKPAPEFGLEDGLPIKLRLTRTISSANAKTNDTIDFEVLENVKVKDVIIIPRGGIAWGTVTEAQSKRRMGRAGKLNVNIDDVRLASGEKAALRAVRDVKGDSHIGRMTGAIVATSIVFFPAAPLFLFMHGKDITIPQGTEITAYISGTVELDRTKFTPVTDVSTATDQSSVATEAKIPGQSAQTHVVSIVKTNYELLKSTMTATRFGSGLDAVLEESQQGILPANY